VTLQRKNARRATTFHTNPPSKFSRDPLVVNPVKIAEIAACHVFATKSGTR